jgi:magnesium transporter
MKITVFDSDGVREAQAVDLPGLLASTDATTWVDMPGPTEEDVCVLREVFRIHPLVIEDITNQEQRPKVEEYPDYLFFILNPVAFANGEVTFHELDALIGHNFVVTAHRRDEPVLAEIRRRVPPRAEGLRMSTSYLLYVVMDSVIDAYFPVLDALGDTIEDIENEVLDEPRQATLTRLFHLKRAMIDLWRVVWPQREILNILLHHELPYVERDVLQYHLRDISDHLMWLADMVNTSRDHLSSITDLYMSAVSNRLNRVVNRLTVFALTVGVLTVVGGFYGMNFLHTWPPLNAPWGVPFVLGMMVVFTALLLGLFRWLDWY